MSTERLFQYEDALNFNPDVRECFLAAVREMAEFHCAHSDLFRNLSAEARFDPGSVKNLEDLARIPYIMVNVFKRHPLLSIPEGDITVTFTSSGTGGEVSRLYLDDISAHRQGHMRDAIIRTFGLVSGIPANYLSFSYSPDIAGAKGAAHAHEAYT